MLNREEAIVLVGIIDSYKKDLEKIMVKEDYDLINTLSNQMQNRLAMEQKLTF